MSADKVQEAKLRFFGALYSDLISGEHTADAKLDALIAAVRADERQKCIVAIHGSEIHADWVTKGEFVWLHQAVEAIKNA